MTHLIFVTKYRGQLLIKYGFKLNRYLKIYQIRKFLNSEYFNYSIGSVSKKAIEKYIQPKG